MFRALTKTRILNSEKQIYIQAAYYSEKKGFFGRIFGNKEAEETPETSEAGELTETQSDELKDFYLESDELDVSSKKIRFEPEQYGNSSGSDRFLHIEARC
ncbi:hypothetical protein AYI68_g4519 [Smittium mucronatum]|uniref:Uncharacterized protein n=1 Tax=Smittium mucronatum TaxID=133383 RepID=A0A1R0GWV5_9FUNG|nr:hypothetical protein AYI68_g4519 [Smittium mucronatum]